MSQNTCHMHIGYFGIVVLMVLSPFPPEVFMPLAGFMVAQKELNFVYVVLAGTVGFLLSILPWYFAGRYLGEKGLKRLLVKHRRWLVIPPRKLERANRWFQQRNGQAVFFSLLLPGVRNIIAIPAGISGMRLTAFLSYSTLSAVFWLALLTAAGYALGSRYYLVDKYLGSAYNLVFAVLGIAVVAWGIRQYLQRNQN